MKRQLFALAVAAAIGASASAAAETVYVDDDAAALPTVVVEHDAALPPVVVEHHDGSRVIADCTPPNDAPDCAYFHALIRENFSPHEIALLFGPATGFADYRTSYSRAREHYAAFLDDIEENGLPVPRPVATTVDYDSE